jgi:hypothetical protein
MKFQEVMFRYMYYLLTITHALGFSASPSMKLTGWLLQQSLLFRSQSFLSQS